MPKFKIGDVIVNKQPITGDLNCIVIGNSSDGQVVYEYRHPFTGDLLVAFHNENDFVLKPTKKEGWINIYQHPTYVGCCGGIIFDTEQEAKTFSNEKKATIKIEWEEA